MHSINDLGLQLIKEFESFQSKPYPDPATHAKPFTIGFGSTYYEDGTPVTLQDKPITEERASQLLKHLLDTKFCPAIEKMIKVKVTNNQYAACVSLAYNIGLGNFQNSTVLRCLNAKNWTDAADAFLLWNKANGRIMNGLVRRREAERALFLTP